MAGKNYTNSAIAPQVNALQSLIDFYNTQFHLLSENKQLLEQILKMLKNLKFDDGNKLYVVFEPDDIIREETVRDILKIDRETLEYYKAQGLIAQVNKRKIYRVGDVLRLKNFLAKENLLNQ